MLERQLPGVEYSFGRCFVVACCSICCVAAAWIDAAEPTPTRIKIENFDHDPGWQALNNREPVEGSKTVEQDFGYSATQHAGAVGRAADERPGPRVLR